jgi:hypothetical protein
MSHDDINSWATFGGLVIFVVGYFVCALYNGGRDFYRWARSGNACSDIAQAWSTFVGGILVIGSFALIGLGIYFGMQWLETASVPTLLAAIVVLLILK